jgi:ABC-type transport system substrate-binding protein/class 3 adenylate cyclase
MAVSVGERRIVTVLFVDIADSTGIGERLGPERSAFLFDEVLRLMSAQVERYDGTVAQLLGDGLLAIFGAPLAHEDDSERAVRAGLAIQRALAGYAREVEAAYGVTLAARIGLNTGPVVVSAEAEDGDERYNALGDTVNVAARLQEVATTGGGLVLGPETARLVGDCFELEPLGDLELKGKRLPVGAFRVAGEREAGTEAPQAPLVGREFELTVLQRAMDGLAEGRGVIVSIVGEPGIGKSRLVAEAIRGYRDRIRFVEGRSVSYAENFPYWPIRDLLREWLGIGVTTPEARSRLELKAELAHLLSEEAEGAYPFIASLLGIALEPDAAARVRELNRESLQRETFEFFGELVCRLSAETPLCLVLEDLHWADDSTLELLEALLPVTDEAAVGLLLLHRSEREHGSWRLGERARQRHPHRYREIELRPLPDDASRTLAANVAGAELPESVARLLTDRAGGNPFFLEEALHDLVERGALRRDDGRLVLAVGEDELSVPALVQGALQARLDRLEPATRETVSIAAVIGRTFGLPLLERILPHDQLVSSLSDLQRLDLVVETRRRPSPEYRFRHGLVQEVAYASLLEATRRKLHRRVGDALEQLYPESRDEIYGLLARHSTEADLPEKAADYLLKAGDAARALYADQEALGHYERARDFLMRLGDERRARDTLFKMALAHHLAFDFERAEEAYDAAFCCRVPPSERLERTERLETGMPRNPTEILPGGEYTTGGAALLEHLFRGLLAVDRDLNVLPAMADNLRVSRDGLTYLFQLREGMRWSDGVPVTADDFVFGWRRMQEEGLPTAFLMEDVAEAEALDDRTLEVRMREPRSYFPYLLASPWCHPWPRHTIEALGDDWRRPENLVSNGPFVLSEYSGESAVLTANPHWEGPHGNVREVRVELGRTNAELLEGWHEGRYDLLEVYDSSAADSPDTVADVVPGLATHYVGFCATKPPFSSELVRKAFSHALDRAAVLPAAGSLARPATRGGALPPAMPGHSHRIAPELDLELARRLLADAGYPEGKGLPELELHVPEWLERPELLVEQWARLGARFRVVRGTTRQPCNPPETAHLWTTGWTVDFPDPDGFFRGFMRQRLDFHRDDEIAELLERARSVRNQDERMRLYHEADRLLVAERAAILPVFYGRSLLVRRTWVENAWANPMSGVHFDQVVVNRPR